MRTKVSALSASMNTWVRDRLRVPRLVLLLTLLAVLATACGPLASSSASTTPAAPPARTATSTSTPAPTHTPTPTTTPATPNTGSGASTKPAGTPASASVVSAIKQVIQRGDQEQAQALAANDPTLMRDTATPDYYAQLTQIQNSMINSGISSIKLDKLTWGAITLTGATTAQATDVETWSTTFTDQGTLQQTNTNVYTLVLQDGAWKVQADQQPDTSPQTPPAASNPGTNPGPGAPATPSTPVDPTGLSQSENWAGYAASGGTFTAIHGSWTVPDVGTATTPAGDATWVGIGGVDSTDLIQAGTDAMVQGGTVTYDAWYELLPEGQQVVPLEVKPGDQVSVSITEQTGDTWQIVIHDATSNQTYQTSVDYASSNSSAEWIEEAPALGGRMLIPLDSFGSVTFTHDSTVENGQTRDISQAGGQSIAMYNADGQVLAQTSRLTADGTGFAVTRTSAPASPTSPGTFRHHGFGRTP